jgi:transmembrane sensor
VSAWRTRQLYFDDDRLGEVLSEMNRYAPKRLVSNTADIQALTLTGEFAAGDVDTLLFSLQKLYGVAAQDRGDHILLTLAENR